jgi:hypothetical protein
LHLPQSTTVKKATTPIAILAVSMNFGNGDRVVAQGADIVGRGALYQIKGWFDPLRSYIGFEVGHIVRANFGHCVVSLDLRSAFNRSSVAMRGRVRVETIDESFAKYDVFAGYIDHRLTRGLADQFHQGECFDVSSPRLLF